MCQIVHKDELKLAAKRVRCRFSEFPTEIPKAFKMLLNALDDIPHLVNRHVQMGVHLGEEDEEIDFVNGLYDYFVSVEVSEFEALPEGFEPITVTEQAYVLATANHTGDVKKIDEAYDAIARCMEKEDFKQIYDAFTIEHYDERYDFSKSAGPIDILVPIKR